MPKIHTANAQYKVRESTSMIVVMKGDATTAGSSLHFLANKGSSAPISFATTMVTNMEMQITNATSVPFVIWYKPSRLPINRI